MLEDMAMQLIFWIEIVAILAVSAVVFGITWIEPIRSEPVDRDRFASVPLGRSYVRARQILYG